MEQSVTHAEPTSIHPATHIGLVTLRVADLQRSLNFYEQILGFQRLEHTPNRAVLGTDERVPLLALEELPGASPQPRYAAGLYHVAILTPSRASLGRVLMRLAENGVEVGHGDHLVSEALYISDPDENGLEIYQDRPRSTWQWANGSVSMATKAVNLRSLLEDGKNNPQLGDLLTSGTRIGHIHLQVADIPQAEHFYHDILGFDITARMPQALFISAGGYHHHIGMNTWQSLNAPPAPKTGAGLQTFVVALPHQQARAEVVARLAAHNIATQEQDGVVIVADPWNNLVHLVIEE